MKRLISSLSAEEALIKDSLESFERRVFALEARAGFARKALEVFRESYSLVKESKGGL
jgi:hypothetical protein